MGRKSLLSYVVPQNGEKESELRNVTPPLPSPGPFSDPIAGSVDRISSSDSRSGTPSSMDHPSAQREALDLVKNQVMVNYLYQQQSNNGWRNEGSKYTEGVLLRVAREQYIAHPPELIDSQLAVALRDLNVQAAMTIQSPVIRTYLTSMPNTSEIPLLNGLAVQVVPDLTSLSRARTHQFAACVASEALLIVWDDDAINMLNRAKTIEWELMQLLWSTPSMAVSRMTSKMGSKTGSKVDLTINEKDMGDDDEIALEANVKPRPTIFIDTILMSISLLLIIATLGLGLREIVVETMIQIGFETVQWSRFAYLAFTPIWMFFGMFFFKVLVTNISQMIGPISQIHTNSKHFSAKTVPRLTRNLPHVTIQCPVYKEDLDEVIKPTVVSIKAAISTYELQGGSANIFINDDGMQLISEEERNDRIAFYADNGIGWTARPKHDSANKDGFKRKGKFKKASNMNFGLSLSCAVEDLLLSLERGSDWTSTDEAEATEWALEQAIADGGGIAWADGNIRVGDYILIIDSDTRVPTDCLLDAVSELETSPEVGILQFSSGVMNVTDNYFEMGITFFTNLVYSAIRFGVANGDVAPFVGHNAILRWSAVQDVAFEEDGIIKFWSESHVSEDFDMALRQQIKGYITRLAAWAGDGFKEGVSLTAHDELARWQKYAYGCNELMFHPFRLWITRGPFTPLFKRFVFSNMPFCSKISIISYIGTYYAIGAAWIMTVVNYFIIGWFKGYVDKYYVNSWKIWFVVILVFNGLGNVALATLRYRTGERSFISSLVENFLWLPLLFIFLGGISIHVSEALLAHAFEIDMTWGATAKTMEFTNFFIEVPRTLRRFWFSFSFSIVCIAAMVILAKAPFVPHGWEITQLEPIIPMASLIISHVLLPLALNPGLMTFAW